MSAYAWTITTDHLAEELGTKSDAGTVGPRRASAVLTDELEAGKGRPFRLYDDDGELLYSGRIVFHHQLDGACLPEEAFGPLDDFGGPNAGATEIRYHLGGRWTTL